MGRCENLYCQVWTRKTAWRTKSRGNADSKSHALSIRVDGCVILLEGSLSLGLLATPPNGWRFSFLAYQPYRMA